MKFVLIVLPILLHFVKDITAVPTESTPSPSPSPICRVEGTFNSETGRLEQNCRCRFSGYGQGFMVESLRATCVSDCMSTTHGDICPKRAPGNGQGFQKDFRQCCDSCTGYSAFKTVPRGTGTGLIFTCFNAAPSPSVSPTPSPLPSCSVDIQNSSLENEPAQVTADCSCDNGQIFGRTYTSINGVGDCIGTCMEPLSGSNCLTLTAVSIFTGEFSNCCSTCGGRLIFESLCIGSTEDRMLSNWHSRREFRIYCRSRHLPLSLAFIWHYTKLHRRKIKNTSWMMK